MARDNEHNPNPNVNAARIVGESLDEAAHQRLIDEYIDQVAGSGSEQG